MTLDFLYNRIFHSPDGCWYWTGSVNTTGYGIITVRKNKITSVFLSHRISYQLHKGNIPHGLFICHSCDNPLCINPDHLWAGTHQENMDDMWRKGRRVNPSGEKAFHVKIDNKKAFDIKVLLALGFGMTFISRKLNVSYFIVRNIKLGGWGHINIWNQPVTN